MIDLRKQNVLLFTRTMQLGGTENVILQLCEILQPKVNKIIVCSCGGVNIKKLNEMRIKHILIDDIENKSILTILNTSKTLKNIHPRWRLFDNHFTVRGRLLRCKTHQRRFECTLLSRLCTNFSRKHRCNSFDYRFHSIRHQRNPRRRYCRSNTQLHRQKERRYGFSWFAGRRPLYVPYSIGFLADESKSIFNLSLDKTRKIHVR